MEINVGTCGWAYSWNKGHSLQWYVDNAGLNAIELNSSFYRFPYSNIVKSWAKKGQALKWVVKVHRLITHIHLLSKNAVIIYERFLQQFKPLDSVIVYYLFQFPPKFKVAAINKLYDFFASFNTEKMAFEFRNKEWYNFDFNTLDFKGIIVTPDSPEIQNKIFIKNHRVYVRFHGRVSWYSYSYSTKELTDVAYRILAKSPNGIFAFFNNDHDMLENARQFYYIISSLSSSSHTQPPSNTAIAKKSNNTPYFQHKF